MTGVLVHHREQSCLFDGNGPFINGWYRDGRCFGYCRCSRTSNGSGYVGGFAGSGRVGDCVT